MTRLAQPLFALACLGAGILFPWSELLLSFFGEGFVAAGPSLRWLLVATCVIYLGAALMTAVVAAGRTRSMLVIAVLGLAVNLLGNTVLVPRFGIEGAAMATLATEVTVALGGTVALLALGATPFWGRRAILWLGGPAAFAVGATVSSWLPLS